ncbi:MAG: MFS transporter [Candidatus Ratteibacteria bacterium]|jgi:MFS family permease
MTKERQAVLAISVTGFFAFVGAAALQIYLGPYFKEILKIPPLKASLVLATCYTFMALGRFIAPYLIARLGAIAVLTVGAVTYVIFPLTFSITRFYPVFIFSAVLWGLGAGLFMTSSMVELLNFSEAKRYASNQGVQGVFTWASQIIGLFFLGQCLILFGYPSLFRLATLLSMAAPVCVYFLVPVSAVNHQPSKFEIVARRAFNFKNWLIFFDPVYFRVFLRYHP